MVKNRQVSFRKRILWGFIAVVLAYTLASILVSTVFLSKTLESDVESSSIKQAQANLEVFQLNMRNIESIYMGVMMQFFIGDFVEADLLDQDPFLRDLTRVSSATNALVKSFEYYNQGSGFYFSTLTGVKADYEPEWLQGVADAQGPIMAYEASIGYHGMVYDSEGHEIHLLLSLYKDALEEMVVREPFIEGTKQYVLSANQTLLMGDDLKDPQVLYQGQVFQDQVQLEGRAYNVYVSSEETYGLTYAYLVPRQMIYRPVYKDLRVTIATFCIIAILTVCISFYISRGLYQPISALKAYVDGYAAYNWDREEVITQAQHSSKLPKEFVSLHDSIDHLVYQINKKIGDIREISRLRDNEQLKNITTAVNPHFQFNILNSIIWMLEDDEVEASIEVLSALGKHYRKTMDINKSVVTIGEELDAMMNYFHLYNLTLEKQVDIHVTCPEPLRHYSIQTLMLQPIVENAILHAFAKEADGKVITVCVSQKDKDICIEIQDNGQGIDENKLQDLKALLEREQEVTTSYGLWNVHKRCHLLYGEGYGITIESQVHTYTKIALLIRGEIKDEHYV